MSRSSLCIRLVAGAAAAGLALAITMPLPAQRRTLAGSDRTFIRKAAQGGMAEVQLGKLASRKGRASEVRQFGQQMVDDHSAANQELRQLAQTKRVRVPATVGAKHAAIMAKLRRLSGAAFDRAYMTEMVRDHREDVAEFQREGSRGRDRDVRSWAASKVPTLKRHLQMAQDARRQVASR